MLTLNPLIGLALLATGGKLDQQDVMLLKGLYLALSNEDALERLSYGARLVVQDHLSTLCLYNFPNWRF
jgi:hypothetical protein